MSRQYWILKSEPHVFSIYDLRNSKNGTASWDGVRNYQARNFLRDGLRKGDGILVYHSSTSLTGIAGEAVVVREGYPDASAWDPQDPYYDSSSSPEKPRWYCVDVKYIRTCRTLISLAQLRQVRGLRNMMLLRRGIRLSVQPMKPREWETIMNLPQWR